MFSYCSLRYGRYYHMVSYHRADDLSFKKNFMMVTIIFLILYVKPTYTYPSFLVSLLIIHFRAYCTPSFYNEEKKPIENLLQLMDIERCGNLWSSVFSDSALNWSGQWRRGGFLYVLFLQQPSIQNPSLVTGDATWG